MTTLKQDLINGTHFLDFKKKFKLEITDDELYKMLFVNLVCEDDIQVPISFSCRVINKLIREYDSLSVDDISNERCWCLRIWKNAGGSIYTMPQF